MVLEFDEFNTDVLLLKKELNKLIEGRNKAKACTFSYLYHIPYHSISYYVFVAMDILQHTEIRNKYTWMLNGDDFKLQV